MSETQTIELYDFPFSIYCQMVRVALAEKGAVYETRPIDITQKGEQFEHWYLALNPTGVVPTLVLDGEVHIESKNILRRIDAEVSGVSLTPADATARAEMDAWMARADEIDYAAMLYATKVTPDGKCPPLLGRLARLRAVREALPHLADTMDERIRENLALQPRVASPAWRAEQAAQIQALLADLDAQLADRPWIAGSEYSLADIMWTATLARLSLLGHASFQDGRYANVARYYAALRARSTWKTAKVFDRMPESFAAGSPQPQPPAPRV